MVLKPLKPAVVPEPVLVLKLGSVATHVEMSKLVVKQEIVVLGFVVSLEPVVALEIVVMLEVAVALELAVALDTVVEPKSVVGSSLATSGSPATQVNILMNRSSSDTSASCPLQAPVLRWLQPMLQLYDL